MTKIEVAGQYRGTIKNYGISETSEKSGKKPQVFVTFDVMVFPEGYTAEQFDQAVTDFAARGSNPADPLPEFPTVELTWFGSLNEGQARQITFDAVMKMGLQNGAFSKLADGPDGKSLKMGFHFGLSVKENEYEGKTTMKIASIYIPGEAFGIRGMDKGTAISALAGLGTLEGDFAKRQAAAMSGAGPVNTPAPTAKKPEAAAKPAGKKPGF